jgi:tetratricopeptide (TPR) repeat protein
MDWIIKNLIVNNKLNWVLLGTVIGLLILHFIIFPGGSEFAFRLSIVILIIYWIKILLWKIFRKLHDQNSSVIDSMPDILAKEEYDKMLMKLQDIRFFKYHLIGKSYWTGIAKMYLGDYKEALVEFDNIEKENLGNSGFLYYKGLVLSHLNEFEKSAEYLTRSIEIEGESVNYARRGWAYFNLDRLKDAEKDFLESIAIEETHSNLNFMGVLYSKKGDNEKALDYYAKAIEKDDSQISAFYNLGLLRKKTDDYDLAIENFDKAEALGMNERSLFLNRGICKCKIGNIRDGLTELQKAKELDCPEANDWIAKYASQ